MKIAHFIAAASMVAGLGVSTAATAQDYRGHRYDRQERRYDRGHHGYRGQYGYRGGYGYRGYARGYYGRSGRRCHVEYRHHRRVTVCYR